MHCPASAGRAARVLALAAALLGLSACLAQPPAESASARLGTVRAATRARAEDIARAFDELAPRVVKTVPGAHLEPLEVWLQQTPTLYSLRASTYSDTDGFWAEGVRRIHLRDSAEQVHRTLAHELVHASLDAVWDRLPGTLEEGLCDLVAARLVPGAAARLRAGRLATAAAAIGGLPLDVELWIEDASDGPLTARGLEARLRIVAEEPETVDPGDVFVVRAGLSTSRATAGARRAFYGLGFLVAERIAARGGLEGLLGLCQAAERDGLESIPAGSLLAAADLEPARESYLAAILEGLGPAELREILRLHPGALVEPVANLLGLGSDLEAWDDLAGVRGRISIPGSRDAVVQILDLTALRPRLEAESAERWNLRNRALAGKPTGGPASEGAR
ncbi:MAG: hypothetical protein NTY35_12240 [Planctomycetota bacterium]|nr:hypothetical protein [Planctomycetota bacterium]